MLLTQGHGQRANDAPHELRFDANTSGQNGHDFVGSAGGQQLAPVVGFGVAFFVQVLNGEPHGAGVAEQYVANGFEAACFGGLGGWCWVCSKSGGRGDVQDRSLKHCAGLQIG